jgi:CHAT domain-containing protein
VEFRADGQLLKPKKEEKASGGRRYLLSIPKPVDRLTVGPSWSLRLAEPEQPAWWDPVKDLIGHRKTTEARKRLEQIQRSAPRQEQGFVWRLLALAAHNEDRAQEEVYLEQGIAADRSENRWSGVAQMTTWLAGIYIDPGRFRDAGQLLAALQLPPQAPADAKFNVIYYQGVLAERTRNYAAALKQLKETTALAEKIGDTRLNGQSRQELALIYQQLGRSQDASTLLKNMQAHPKLLPNRCALGTFWTNVGWLQLLEREAGHTAGDPAPALQQALAAFEKNDCSSEQRLNAHLNLALAYQQRHEWPEASRELDSARALAQQADLGFLELLWQKDLEARQEIHAGHPEIALHLYEQLEERAKIAASPAGLLQAQLGRANAYVDSHQPQEAIKALAQADRQIEEQSRHIPVHEGRDTYFATQEAATRLYLKLLLDEGQNQKAFDLARKSRSRLLRQLAVRDSLSQLDAENQQAWIDSLSKYRATRDAVDAAAAKRWQLPVSEKASALEDEAAKLKDAQEQLDSALRDLEDALRRNVEGELAPPERDEVILIYHPLLEKQWAAFAVTREREPVVAYFELENVPAEQLAHRLLAKSPAFQAAIATSKRVRVLPYGPLRTVDFHALPFKDGQPLLATHLVAYSLDLPRRSASPSQGGEALVVSNPTRDLRTADTEGETVAAAIRRWGGKPQLLNGSAAQAGTVRQALTRASFFHYAGHGSFGGFAGWSSELPLADESRLTLSDVLALSHVPDAIVLSACDAGRTSEEAPGEGVGLANAFLLAGAKEVIAARQSVPDASANELMDELYRHWQPGEDLAHQLRRAQLACRQRDPSPKAAWASFRLLVP